MKRSVLYLWAIFALLVSQSIVHALPVTVIHDSYDNPSPNGTNVYAPNTFTSTATVGGVLTYTVNAGLVHPTSGLGGIVNFFGGNSTVGDMFTTFNTTSGSQYEVDFSTQLVGGVSTSHALNVSAIDGAGVGGAGLGSSGNVGINQFGNFTFTALGGTTTLRVLGVLGTPNNNADIAINNLMVTTEAIDPIPEPSTLVLFGVGFLGLVGYVVRRKRRK